MNLLRRALVAPAGALVTLAAWTGSASASGLPVGAMEKALQAKGGTSNGVLSVGIDRSDITGVSVHGVPIKPAFEVDGELDFQSLGGGRALLNGDLAVKPSEINAVIDAIHANGLVFQAEHQHFYDFDPMVWFIHLRGRGEGVSLATRTHAVIEATSTPLPQAPPSKPKTPLSKTRLQKILHGYDAEVGDDGVVTVYVRRRKPVHLEGIRAKPETNVSTNIAFEPLNHDGSRAAVVPDFGMVSGEIGPVITTMRSLGWDIGCLYNQETDERPQLYFSHDLKTGDPYALAAEVRSGLDHMNVP
jgi:hypothetical protein